MAKMSTFQRCRDLAGWFNQRNILYPGGSGGLFRSKGHVQDCLKPTIGRSSSWLIQRRRGEWLFDLAQEYAECLSVNMRKVAG